MTQATQPSQAQLLQKMGEFIVPNYGPRLRAMVRAKGAKIWDADGNEYIDFFVGFGGGGVGGHCHPAIVQAVQRQAERLMSHGNFFTNEQELDLAERITSHAFGGKVFFCHSGAEANEAAIKLVRLAAGEGRYKIISFQNCFHGRTMGSLSITSEKYQTGLGPMMPGNSKAVYGDLDSVRALIDDETAGVFVEPIQGEGGVNVPRPEFLQGLRSLCDAHGMLLVVDEVWTAPARTGKWFAYQHFGFTPDAMTLAKAIGGGAPVAACVVAPKWQDVLGPGTHGCTLGGNPLCTSAAAAAIRLIEEEGLVERAVQLGDRIRGMIDAAALPVVRGVRGKGAMLGLEVDRPAPEVFRRALELGLFIAPARDTVVRLAPPLTICDEELSLGMEKLLKALAG